MPYAYPKEVKLIKQVEEDKNTKLEKDNASEKIIYIANKVLSREWGSDLMQLVGHIYIYIYVSY